MPALFAVVIAMFSLESRPAAVPQALAADVLFDGRVALSDARRLAAAHPDRRPATTGDRLVAAQVAGRLRADHFDVSVDRFSADGRQLVNVVGRRVGATPRQLVVVAARDARTVPDLAGSAADTAALMEVARTLEGRVTSKTLVLASVDGSTLGAAGARRLAGRLAAAGPVEAVVVISQLGVARAKGPLLVPWGDSAARGGLRLQRTLDDSLRLEVERGGAGSGAGTLSQFGRLALPVAVGDQAPFLDAGLDAVRLSGSGELPPRAQPPPSADRIGSLGRATLRSVFAYDSGGRIDEKPRAFLVVAHKLLPSWAVSLLAATLLLPLLAAAVDSFARVRRRREPVIAWLRWLASAMLPFLLALATGELLVLVGQAPDAPPVPLPPRVHPLDGAAGLSLGLCALVFVLAWLLLRPRVAAAQRLPAPDRPGAAAALALALAIAALGMWAINPFAALSILPAFHVALLVTGSPVAARRGPALAFLTAALAIPLLVLVGVVGRLSLGPLSAPWYAFLLLTGHHIGLYTAVLSALLAACVIAAVHIALARRPEPPALAGPSVLGPGGHAGPGALGGTDSALGR
ncbi:MAG: hypothetical protein ACJ76Z_17060 [Thermoleophilaceae bacterium]